MSPITKIFPKYMLGPIGFDMSMSHSLRLSKYKEANFRPTSFPLDLFKILLVQSPFQLFLLFMYVGVRVQ